MEAQFPQLKSYTGLSVVLSFLVFRVLRMLLQYLPVPKVVRQDAFRIWKWRNLSVSLLHSLLSATWALTCVVGWPETFRDIHFHTPVSSLLVSVSTGYFIHDACDIIFSGHARGSWEFLLHHTLVISAFLYTLITRMYLAGAVIALLVEVNSVTLHVRMLLKMVGAQNSSVYHVHKFINMATYFAFRLSAQAYLTWYILVHYSSLVHAAYFLFSMVMMDIIIVIYLYRLVRTDFFSVTGRRTVAQNGTHNNNVKKFLSD
ncbi:TLC domain-containing protein 1 [Neosynchiropus ocellatus]